MDKKTTMRVEIMEITSHCRSFNAQGHRCGNYTKRVVVTEQEGREDIRRADCGKHGKR